MTRVMTAYGTFYTPCGEGFYCLPDELPVPGAFSGMGELKRAHAGSFFSRGNMRFFGDRAPELRHGFARVCEQLEAPDGVYRFACTYWRMTADGATAAVTCRHATRELARTCAALVARDGFIRCACGVSSASDPAAHDDACPVSQRAGGPMLELFGGAR